MRSAISLTKGLLLASTLALASSCADKARIPPPANLNPPANLLAYPDEPKIPLEAATSEQAFEKWREDHHDWGQTVAGVATRACWWLKDSGVTLDCRPRQ